MRKTSGGWFYNAVETATTAAPTLDTDGMECQMHTIGGDKFNADEWTIIAAFLAGTTPTVDAVLWVYIGDQWVAGSTFTLKATSDANGGNILDVPAHGAATRLYIQLTAYTGAPTSVTMQAYHNEHSEAM